MKYFSMIATALILCGCEVSIPNDVNVLGNKNQQNKELQLDDQPQTTSETISNEQDFDAVATVQTVESDAERIAANRAKYIVIDVQTLPMRTDNLPNVVEYAQNHKILQISTRLDFNFSVSSASMQKSESRLFSSDLAGKVG